LLGESTGLFVVMLLLLLLLLWCRVVVLLLVVLLKAEGNGRGSWRDRRSVEFYIPVPESCYLHTEYFFLTYRICDKKSGMLIVSRR
jgi:hypothetical protein